MTLTGWAPSRSCPGIRTYVAVDGGMSDNPRPVLYGSGYEAFLPRAGRAPRGHGRCGWWASTARRATSWWPTPGCRPTWRWATSWPRRSPVPTATRWPPTTTRCPGRRSSSWPTGGPGGGPAGDARRPAAPRRLTTSSGTRFAGIGATAVALDRWSRAARDAVRRRPAPWPTAPSAWPCSAAATSAAPWSTCCHRGRRDRRAPASRFELVGRRRRATWRDPRPGRSRRTCSPRTPRRLVERPDVDVVVELIGGPRPGPRPGRGGSGAGRPVVTANKALLADARGRAGRRWPRRRASTCSTRRRWPAPSRSSGPCGSRWPASGSTG